MKKVLSLLISLFIVSQVIGQWSIGPRAGINFCVTKGKWNEFDESKYKWIASPTFGATAGYTFNEHFALNADMLYVNMGQVNEYEWGDASRNGNAILVRERERFNCMQWSFRPTFIMQTNILALLLFLGPYMTFKFGGIYQIDDGTNITRYRAVWGTAPLRGDKEKWYVDPEYNRRLDAGLYVGTAARKELGPGQLELDFRFGFGLIDLNKFDSKEARKDAKDAGYKPYRSKNAMITLAYIIPLGER